MWGSWHPWSTLQTQLAEDSKSFCGRRLAGYSRAWGERRCTQNALLKQGLAIATPIACVKGSTCQRKCWPCESILLFLASVSKGGTHRAHMYMLSWTAFLQPILRCFLHLESRTCAEKPASRTLLVLFLLLLLSLPSFLSFPLLLLFQLLLFLLLPPLILLYCHSAHRASSTCSAPWRPGDLRVLAPSLRQGCFRLVNWWFVGSNSLGFRVYRGIYHICIYIYIYLSMHIYL